MTKRIPGVTMAVAMAMVAAVPAVAGDGECSAHAAKAAAQPAATVYEAGHAHAKGGASCDDAIARAERTVEEIDGGVKIVFASKDKKVLDEIVRLANEGRILGARADGTALPRRVKREGRKVILTATGRSADDVRLIRSVAARFSGSSPECGEHMATAAAAAHEG